MHYVLHRTIAMKQICKVWCLGVCHLMAMRHLPKMECSVSWLMVRLVSVIRHPSGKFARCVGFVLAGEDCPCARVPYHQHAEHFQLPNSKALASVCRGASCCCYGDV